MKNVLEISHLRKTYHTISGEVEAIKDISINLEDKEFIAIVGSSGCGKSTLLSILANIDKDYEGIVNIKDKKVGYMLQTDALIPWLTIYDNCLLGLKIRKEITEEKKKKALELLKKYNLEDFKDRKPDSLSGGMRQRVALIRTLLLEPDILLLDEPFSALDYQTRLAVSDDVYRIIKNEGKSAIMVTHDIAEALSMAKRVIVLSKRPAVIKNVYEINLEGASTPINNRKCKNFSQYYDHIWKDLDINV